MWRDDGRSNFFVIGGGIQYVVSRSCHLVVNEMLDCSRSMISDWVLQRVKDFYHIVGLLIEGTRN